MKLGVGFLGLMGVLLSLGVCMPASAAPGPRHLSVVYDPPRLSVEAAGVSVAEVLREIGTKVGFAVAEMGLSGAAPSIAITGASLEEVLRQLLDSENHVLLYQEEAAGGRRAVDKIVLLGPSQYPDATAALGTGGPRSYEGRQADAPGTGVGARPVDQASRDLGASSTSHSWIPIAMEREWPRDGPIDPEAADATAADILTRHALSGVPDEELNGIIPVESLAVNRVRATAADPPADVEHALAVTTRLAQRNLMSLVEALATATASLLGSLPAQRR